MQLGFWDAKEQHIFPSETALATTFVSTKQVEADFSVLDSPALADKAPNEILVKVVNRSPDGPRSVAKTLSYLVEPPVGQLAQEPLALIGDAAPGGGTFISFASFYDATRNGDVYFSAEVDMGGGPLDTEAFTFVSKDSRLQRVDLDGFGKIGRAEADDEGNLAFGDASDPFALDLYLLPLDGGSALIASEGAFSETEPNQAYVDLRGPLALSDTGGYVLFGSQLFNPQTSEYSCCYLFRYSVEDNSVVKIVGDGDPLPFPLSGTFNLKEVDPDFWTVA